MTTPEDALKAVESLAEILVDVAGRLPTPEILIGRLVALRNGCEALRDGKRGHPLVRAILDRKSSFSS